MTQETYRHEIKILLNPLQHKYALQLLGPLMKQDCHAGALGFYTVRSLYFDTCFNESYNTKAFGLLKRHKIRLRTYDIRSGFCKLEIKNRQSAGIYKETSSLSALQAQQLIDGDPAFLLSLPDPAARKVYALFHQEPWQPAVLIDYEREPFILPFSEIRVTFDCNIRASKDSSGFFASGGYFTPLFPGGEAVLEIKYNHFLPPHIKEALSSIGGLPMSVSKYCLSRNLLG